jgi:hypothetical protein
VRNAVVIYSILLFQKRCVSVCAYSFCVVTWRISYMCVMDFLFINLWCLSDDKIPCIAFWRRHHSVIASFLVQICDLPTGCFTGFWHCLSVYVDPNPVLNAFKKKKILAVCIWNFFIFFIFVDCSNWSFLHALVHMHPHTEYTWTEHSINVWCTQSLAFSVTRLPLFLVA